MKKLRSWPHRYIVRICTLSNEIIDYTVTTWLYEEKAIAIATKEHQRRFGDIDKKYLFNIEVEEIGPVEANSEGMATIPSGDLGDRMEF